MKRDKVRPAFLKLLEAVPVEMRMELLSFVSQHEVANPTLQMMGLDISDISFH